MICLREFFCSHYLHGSLLEDMIQENMSKFMDKMVKETEPFTPKQYLSLIVFHQLYTICFGERYETIKIVEWLHFGFWTVKK